MLRALVCLLLAGISIKAAPSTGVVKVDKAAVRSGASEKFDITNELPKGSTVEILEELPGGWLKIKPPRGSFSWVNMTFLDRTRPDGSIYVFAPLKEMTAPVYPGSEVIHDRRPTTIGTRLKHGELVVARGEPMQGANGFWLPIEPPASEVRYIHSSALESKSGTSVAPVSAKELTSSAPKGPLPAPKYPSANPTLTPEEEWKEAALAEYVGNYAAAIEMYDALAKKTQTTHPHIAQGAMQRANALRMRASGATTPVTASSPRPLPLSGTVTSSSPRPTQELRCAS
ncbi:MAG: SH3 domain-containing protein, partial [Gemmataceae bacterium]